jgi:prepilin-type N-terminal cleavage/methylation domain-containing protein
MKKGFTLIELMVVILIVAILAAVAIPILRGRIDAAKWSEGKAMMGTIATAVRAYHAEKGPTGALPAVALDGADMGFNQADLTGTYFSFNDFSVAVTAMDPLAFVVTCNSGGGGALPANDFPTTPGGYTLNQNGVFTAVP